MLKTITRVNQYWLMDLKKILVRSQILILLLLTGWTSGLYAQQKPDSLVLRQQAPDSVFEVVFETTKGSFTITAHRNWSPRGVDRLYHLVRLNYYQDVPFYRVIPNTYAQFGFTNDLAVTKAWANTPIPDEPVKKSNTYGRVHFARIGPDTRAQHLSIMLSDHTHLDTISVNGVTGFVPIGEVTEGIDVVESLNMEYGNEPRTHIKIDSTMKRGGAYLRRTFPGLDYINGAYINLSSR